MTHDSMAERYLAETHRVENIPPLLEHYNLYTQDPALMEAVTREGGAWANETLTQFGALTGSRERIYWGEQANRYPPR
ncbi:MAG TPA: DNA alkylation response protein, partial [Porticoccaceae bacterium]|nr:DNA alkylation response protein [Porticoccaceae bacterium]